MINNSDLSDKIAQSETEESARHKLNLKAGSELWGAERPGQGLSEISDGSLTVYVLLLLTTFTFALLVLL